MISSLSLSLIISPCKATTLWYDYYSEIEWVLDISLHFIQLFRVNFIFLFFILWLFCARFAVFCTPFFKWNDLCFTLFFSNSFHIFFSIFPLNKVIFMLRFQIFRFFFYIDSIFMCTFIFFFSSVWFCLFCIILSFAQLAFILVICFLFGLKLKWQFGGSLLIQCILSLNVFIFDENFHDIFIFSVFILFSVCQFCYFVIVY